MLYHQLNFEPNEFGVGSHLLIQWVYKTFIITELAIGLQGNSCVLMATAFVFAIVYHLELKRGYFFKALDSTYQNRSYVEIKEDTLIEWIH